MTDENEEDRINRIRKLLDSEAETQADLPFRPDAPETNGEKPGTYHEADLEGNHEADQAATTRASAPRRTPTPPPGPIPLDKDNMPLPRRVDQLDMEGTRVTPAAYGSSGRPRAVTPQANNASTPRPSQPPPARPSLSLEWLSGWGGCLVRRSSSPCSDWSSWL
jgi:hypothetical protein